MHVAHTPQKIAKIREAWVADGLTTGFIPTMGALHAGHMALVEQAKDYCDRVMVSIFVNPKQFGPAEDFGAYPRTLEADSDLLKAHGVNLLFLPDAATLYPPGFSTRVEVDGLTGVLCGASRPGHFSGVATVVTLLLMIAEADFAFFGEKDYQQLQVIRRMATDLRLPSEIFGVPTVREQDGLAMSSRNRYLNAEERKAAPLLYAAMRGVREDTARPLAQATGEARERLEKAGFRIDYLEARHADTLELSETRSNARLFAAVFLGATRLIDNIALD